MASEQVIQKKIITMLEKEYDAYVVKVVNATRGGVPDLLVCIEGLFLAIEVKRPESKNNVSKLQEYNLKKIEDCGGNAIVAWNTEMVREVADELIG